MGDALVSEISRWISSEDFFHPGDRVGVAVSGGSDSLALLLILHGLAERLGLVLAVLHFDHQLRPESAAEMEFVRAVAERLGLPFHAGGADVRERMRQTGRNLEESARAARYDFFRAVCVEQGIACLATGHTADDQAETVLFHLLRGSGPAGLAGIRPQGRLPGPSADPEIRLVRPLLRSRRQQLREWLSARGQEWRDDPSNELLDRSRNRIRHQLLPQLCRDFNPSLVETLAGTADILRAEEDDWEARVAQAMAALPRVWRDDGSLEAGLEGVRRLPPGLRRRVVRALIAEVQGDLRRVDYFHTCRLVEWIGERPPAPSEAGRGPRRLAFAGIEAEVTAHVLRLRRR